MPSAVSPPAAAVAHDDESVRRDIAVRALGNMRSRASGPISSSGEGRATPSNSKNGEQDESQQQPASNRDFVSRMSSLPLVGTALRAYEQGKASSRVVKYGAQMVESGVKTISKPVIDRLPVNQIDEFACRQLDKLDKIRRPSVGPESPRSPVSPTHIHSTVSRHMSNVNDAGPSSTSAEHETARGRPKLRTKTLDGSPDNDISRREDQEGSLDQRNYVGNDRSVPQWIESTHPYTRPSGSGAASPMDDSRIGSPIILEDRRTRSPEHHSPNRQTPHLRRRYSNNDGENSEQNSERQVAQRSRWQTMLLEAGGLGVALSDENMRRLKYCLHWLLYATAHIDAQILILRNFIESIQPMPQTNSTSHRRPPISEEQLQKLTEVRKDIVTTIRQMVDVVSKYAGGALPEPARGRVRGFILKLPQRWASRTTAAGVSGVSVGSTSTSGSSGERERETVAAAGSSTGVLRRGQGRDKRAAQRGRGTGSRAPSPSLQDSHTHSRHPSQSNIATNQQLTHSHATAAAQRILTLATESLDMMRNVTGVVKDSLDRADAWVNRLRMVGVQRSGQEGVNNNDEALNEEFGPPRVGPQYDATSMRDDYRTLFQAHRRGGSTSSSILEGDDEASFSGSMPASPFTTATTLSHGSSLISTSSYTAGSTSMPSTPTGTSITSPPTSSVSVRDVYGSTAASAPSPGAIPLASMHIASRLNTPKMGVVGLPAEDEVLIENGKGESLTSSSSRRSSVVLRMEVDES